MALLQRIKLLREGKMLRGSAAVRENLADPVRVFVKKEPHKLQKILLERFRLIASVSLIDSLVERLLYQRRAKKEIKNWASIPSKPGMGSSDEHIQVLAAEIGRMLLERGVILDSDAAGWDWQVKWWLLLVGVFVDLELLEVSAKSDYGKMCLSRESAAIYPVLSDSAGVMYELGEPIMCSGRFVTSYRNSRMRTALSAAADTKCICMGDDCNEAPKRSVDWTLRVYDALGYPADIFEVVENRVIDGLIFCSLRFYEKNNGEMSAEPVRWIRSLYRLLSKRYTLTDLSQFEYEVRNSREYMSNTRLRAALRAPVVAEVGSPQVKA